MTSWKGNPWDFSFTGTGTGKRPHANIQNPLLITPINPNPNIINSHTPSVQTLTYYINIYIYTQTVEKMLYKVTQGCTLTYMVFV